METRMATLCECGSVAGWQNWPDGYNSSSIIEMDEGQLVPLDVWGGTGGDSTRWECSEGSNFLTGLAEGEHEFAVRTLDQSLKPSSTPLVHTWQIDAARPMVGLVQVPDVETNNPAATAVFMATKPLSNFFCSRNSMEVECNTAIDSATATIGGDPDRDGAVTVGAGGVDLSGLTTESAAVVTWTIDTKLPLLILFPENLLVDGFEIGFSVNKPGIHLYCRIFLLQDGHERAISNSCTPAIGNFCKHLTLGGLGFADAAAAEGLTGLYNLVECGIATACLLNGRPLYLRDGSDVSLRHLLYDGSGWIITGSSPPAEGESLSFIDTLLRIDSDAPVASGLGLGSTKWRSGATGEILAEVAATCGLCGQDCQVVYQTGLAPGRYRACVRAQDRAGNLGNDVCTAVLAGELGFSGRMTSSARFANFISFLCVVFYIQFKAFQRYKPQAQCNCPATRQPMSVPWLSGQSSGT